MLQMVGNSICRNPGQDHLSPVAEMQESVLVPSGFGQNVRASDISPVLYFLSYLFSRSESQSCPTLCDPMDCGILPARILEWVAFPFSRGSSQPQGLNPSLLHCRQILYQLSHQGSPRILEWVAYPLSRGSS